MINLITTSRDNTQAGAFASIARADLLAMQSGERTELQKYEDALSQSRAGMRPMYSTTQGLNNVQLGQLRHLGFSG